MKKIWAILAIFVSLLIPSSVQGDYTPEVRDWFCWPPEQGGYCEVQSCVSPEAQPCDLDGNGINDVCCCQ